MDNPDDDLADRIGLDTLATVLLRRNFLLTALELHQELIEHGIQVPVLGDFFADFNETHGAEEDFAKFSQIVFRGSRHSRTDHGLGGPQAHGRGAEALLSAKDEHISMLEYELRLIKEDLETMKGRFERLSQTGERPSDQGNEWVSVDNGTTLDVERRALLYLIQSFLMENGQKLTAITLSDEVSDQNLNDWSDVGAPQGAVEPPNLIAVLRAGQQAPATELLDAVEHLKDNVASLEEEKRKNLDEIDTLKQQNASIKALEDILEQQRAEISRLQRANNTLDQPVLVESHPIMIPTCTQTTTVSAYHDDTSTDHDDIVLSVVAQQLPAIIPNVLLNKRDELVPVILSVIQTHGNVEVRDQLTHLLFNLIKAPDDSQRVLIINGCVKLAKAIGYERTEEELLPQCWEQITHSRFERRLLVADSCGLLAPYVRADMRHSLILSILQQLADDKSDVVKAAVASNLAILIGHFEGGIDKYASVESLMLRLINDVCDDVSACAIKHVVPAVAVWSSSNDMLCTGILETLLSRVENGGTEKDLPVFESLMPRLRAAVLLESHAVISSHSDQQVTDSVAAEDNSEDENENDMKLIIEDNALVASLVGGEEKMTELQANVDFLLSATLSSDAGWPAMDWVACQAVPRLAIVAVNQPNLPLSTTIWRLCMSMGPMFSRMVALPLFQQDMEGDGRGHLLTVFCGGILPWLPSKDLVAFVRSVTIHIALGEVGWNDGHLTSLESGARLLRYHRITPLLASLWDMLVHPAAQVRRCLIHLFTALSTVLDEERAAQRVLPALITLGNDPDIGVRRACVHAMSSVAIRAHSSTVLDKLGVQYDSMIEDTDLEDELLGEFAVMIPDIEAQVRDELVLPRLVRLGDRLGSTTPGIDNLKLLYSCYQALNGAVMTRDAITNTIIPALDRIVSFITDPHLSDIRDKFQVILKDIAAISDDGAHQSRARSVFGGIERGLKRLPKIGGKK